MIKHFTILTLAVLAMSLTACSLTGPCEPFDGTVTATLETMTRTQLLPEGDLYKVHWQTGDEIAVTDGSAVGHYSAEAGGSATASFKPLESPSFTSGPYTAWYPASLKRLI